MIQLIAIVAALVLTAPAPAPPIQISATSRSLQPGEIVVLAISLPATSEHVRVRAFDRDIAAYAVGDRAWRAIVGIDLDVKPGTYAVTVESGAGAGRARASYDLV